jgi:hypothetical protein
MVRKIFKVLGFVCFVVFILAMGQLVSFRGRTLSDYVKGLISKPEVKRAGLDFEQLGKYGLWGVRFGLPKKGESLPDLKKAQKFWTSQSAQQNDVFDKLWYSVVVLLESQMKQMKQTQWARYGYQAHIDYLTFVLSKAPSKNEGRGSQVGKGGALPARGQTEYKEYKDLQGQQGQ